MHYFTPRRCSFSGKIMYAQKDQALRAADASRIERGVELWVYRCVDCGCWHLTHEDPDFRSAVARPFAGQGRPARSRKRGYKPRRR
ncbi:hypothetical protein [uncultured Bifidobacterium sp.]|uniref:hypothetical protein n=1 Tax=uncultured Bifidobacterium sp. TaxID=165187 RepID=UPI00262D676F|nr:hypothetical protein [uncultured Bifidobacterium sp.]